MWTQIVFSSFVTYFSPSAYFWCLTDIVFIQLCLHEEEEKEKMKGAEKRQREWKENNWKESCCIFQEKIYIYILLVLPIIRCVFFVLKQKFLLQFLKWTIFLHQSDFLLISSFNFCVFSFMDHTFDFSLICSLNLSLFAYIGHFIECFSYYANKFSRSNSVLSAIIL